MENSLFFLQASSNDSTVAAIFFVVTVFIIALFLSRSESIGNWSHLFINFELDPEDFYSCVEEILKEMEVPNYETKRTMIRQGGILSYHRLYLEVSRGDYTFHICAAPWGNGFFFSWWLRQWVRNITRLPFVGKFFIENLKYKPYYQLDTEAMFRTSVQQSVQMAIERLTKEKGVRGLTELERRPDLRAIVN